MRVEQEDIDTERMEFALSVLREEGLPIQFDNLAIQKNGEVVIFSEWLPENLTKAIAIEEIAKGQELFKKLISQWSGLEIFLAGKSIKYSLAHDYGNGGILIAEIIENSNYKWHHQLKT